MNNSQHQSFTDDYSQEPLSDGISEPSFDDVSHFDIVASSLNDGQPQPLSSSTLTPVPTIDDIIDVTIDEAFGFKPREWQRDFLRLIFQDNMVSSSSAYFLCRPTGGGKSLVRDAFAAAHPGITINIAPLLSLSSDQASKLQTKRKSDEILAIHLDVYDDKQRDEIMQFLLSLSINDSISVVLFTSPQAILNSSNLFNKIFEKKLCRLVAIDEIQLFVQFGCWFRSEFGKLKNAFFSHFSGPYLFMTATADEVVLQQLETMTGVKIPVSNWYWPYPTGMANRRQCIRFDPSLVPMKSFVTAFHNELKKPSHRIIIYGNSRSKLEERFKAFLLWLDKNGYPLVDAVLITGTLSKVQKFHRTTLFLSPDLQQQQSSDSNSSNETEDKNPVTITETSVDSLIASAKFSPRVCFATRSLGSAGWDNSNIHAVFSVDFPSDLLSVYQEMGRTGRRDGADGSEDYYFVCGSIDSYIYLVDRIYASKHGIQDDIDEAERKLFSSIIDKDGYAKLLFEHLQEVIKFFVLPSQCQHVWLERRLARPGSFDHRDSFRPCGNLCQYCIDGGAHSSFPKIVLKDTKEVLLQLFTGEKALANPEVTTTLVNAIYSVKNVSQKIFGSRAARPKKADIKCLLLMLFAAGILRHKYVMPREGDPYVAAHLAVDRNGSPVMNCNAVWSGIPLK